MKPFFHTFIGKTAKQRVNRVLDQGWLNEGKNVQKFEHRLSKLLDLPNLLTTNSCSSSLLLCLLDIDVKDHEVILPAQTFIATGMAVLAAGGKPVFADIDPNTGNLDPTKIKVTDKTKAIIPVLWGGNPCDLDKFPDLPIIQDAAHALGSTIDGKSIANFSDYTCYSFQSIKHLTTGDGGALCTTNPSSKLKRMKWFGIDKANVKRDELGGRIPDVDLFGFKWHMNDYAASLGLANLVGYKRRLKRRRELAHIYETELRGVPGVKLLNKFGESAYWMFTLRVDRRVDLCRKLGSLPYSTVDYGIHKNPVFNWTEELPGQDLFDATQLSFPVHEQITVDDMAEIIKTIKNGW